MSSDAPAAEPRRRITLGRVGVTLVVAGSFVLWFYAFVLAPRGNPDRLEERDFPEEAEALCAAADARLRALPSPREAETTQERSAQVAAGTEVVEAMVSDLRAARDRWITDPEERAATDAWFADWEQYLDDRRAHEDRLAAAPPDATGREVAMRFTEVADGGRYTDRIDGYARVNDMDACVTPGDV